MDNFLSNKKQILLVSGNQLKSPYPVYPIGLSYIATYLRNRLANYEVLIFDFNLNNSDDLEKLILNVKPSFIGVSMRNIDNVNLLDNQNYINYYHTIISICRKATDSTIVLGGAGYSIFPELLFEKLQPDYGIFGEGEEAFFKLITCIDNHSSCTSIEGLVYRLNDKTHSNKKVSFSKNIELNFEPELIDYYWQNSGMLNIQTKRGCPYSCDYCSYPVIEGKTVRTLNPDLIVESLLRLSKEKNIDYVFFTDSIFNIVNSYNITLAEKIIESGLNIKWGAYFSPNNFDKDLIALYKKAGLTHIEFGTDSISEKMLKNYNKLFTVSDVMNASEICNELGVYFAHFLILGSHGETEETLEETFENSKRIENTIFFPAVGARIYPDTALARRALNEGLIKNRNDLMESVYYVSKDIDLSKIKARANETGKKWVFMDDDLSVPMNKMRAKNKKGLLWEYILK